MKRFSLRALAIGVLVVRPVAAQAPGSDDAAKSPTGGERPPPPPATTAPLEPTPAPPRADLAPGGAGMAPGAPQLGTETTVAGPDVAPASLLGGKLQLRGYLRAPMQVGYGPRNDGAPGHELHATARIPDGSYTDWRYTGNAQGPWTQLIVSYGTSRATGTVIIAASNLTDASFRNLQAQLGINQAFVTLTFPEAFGDAGGVTLTAGAFSNRYGTAGKYNAGRYDTYLFGRTHVAGETLSTDLPLGSKWHLLLEHGIGAKIDAIAFSTPPVKADFLPYQGPAPQGSNFVHHAHAGVAFGSAVRVTGHYITSWTPDDHEPLLTPTREGRITVTGGEVRIAAGIGGDGYLGYSHVEASHVLPLASGLEVIHSENGGQLKNNYFGRFDPHTGLKPADDSGQIDSVLFQYSASLGAIARAPARFTGNGADLTVTAFGMFNAVSSDTTSHKMLKYGGELVYSALPWLGLGGRADVVEPDLRYSAQSFTILSAKTIIRTAFIANEIVVLEYSRYLLGSQSYPSFPYDASPAADPNLFQLVASMAW